MPVILASALWAPLACAQDVRSFPGEAGPVFSESGPDAELYGAASGYPVGTRGTTTQIDKLVGVYSHFGEIYPSRPIGRATAPWQFKRAPEPAITYSFGTERLSIADYLKRNPVTGLLIARDDTILYEHYQYARTDHDRFLSQSMAKTLVGMLVGIAVSEGRIKSIDDPVSTYVSGLAGTEYGSTSIRALLNMSSGVEFSEVYDGQDDIARLGRALFVEEPKDPAAVVAQFNTRTAPPGTRWHYASVETEILGLVLRSATGTPVADYLHDRIWDAIGTEADASWAIDGSGQEIAFCCFNATLRDYARLARLLAHDGAWEGRQLIPRAMAAGCHDRQARRRSSRSARGHTLFRLRLSGVAPARRAAQICPARHPRSGHPGRSGLEARHGAHRRSPEAVRTGSPQGAACVVVRRASTARAMI
ncbi:serine hydrolase domain-containing protein [Bradyrhizobium diazoefficiens]|uniref:serine hydrolase domain-containing protein n=1 Tax=Bradyrhizobium diazoefficiens TaxID=1355477 RepID=UPI00272AFD46|nr:serine hydrolase [Bradyrhizobium diazoefficiens]WLA65005.1 serine hydrolase [Bradyrhizobium diazoefficiens]